MAERPGAQGSPRRLELVPLTGEVVSARLQTPGFTAQVQLSGGVHWVQFPVEWPDSGLVILQLLAEAGAIREGDYPGQFVVVERETLQAIGLLGTKGGPDDSGAVEIGYGIIPDRRARGMATEAVAALCDELLGDPSVRKLVATTARANLASQRVLARNGFVQVGSDWSPDDGPLLLWERDRAPVGSRSGPGVAPASGRAR